MSFKYSFSFPISGPNKIPRFKRWVAEYAPDVETSLPPQVPVKAEAMTIRLRSVEDRSKLLEKLKATPLA